MHKAMERGERKKKKKCRGRTTEDKRKKSERIAKSFGRDRRACVEREQFVRKR